MRPGDQLICAFTKPLAVGEKFKEWPLHVTVVPWFRTAVREEVLAEYLKTAVEDEAPFTATVGKQRQFGVVKVNLMEPEQWRSLHEKVLAMVNSNAKNTAPLRFVGKHYRPHVTVQKSARLHDGDSFRCEQLHIVAQKSSHKEIVAGVRLGHE